MPGPAGRRGRFDPTAKAKDFKGTIKKVINYLGGYQIGVIAVMICSVASAILHIVGPKILGKATTALSEGLMGKITGTGGIDFSYIGKILLIVLALYGGSVIFSLIQGFTMSSITQRLCYKLRRELTEKINRMPMKYFESRSNGEVLSRITNDVDMFGNGFNQSVTQLITSLTTMIGVVVMMLTISPLMTLITLLILPISVFFISTVMKKSQKYFIQQQAYLGHINGQIEENYSGHLVIKAFGKEKDVIEEFNNTNNILYESAWKSQFLSGLMMPVMQFVGNLGEVIAAAKSAHADHFIRTLTGGYDFELNEDATNVSVGQRQLLTIARAILADNPMLILDEATSSVDTRTEHRIQKAMDNLMKGRTSFVIAHRLSTIRNADLILVMKDGDIIEQGNHDELMKQQRFYADLYNAQFA